MSLHEIWTLKGQVIKIIVQMV